MNEQQEYEARQAYEDHQDMLAQDYLLREEFARERKVAEAVKGVFDADGNEMIRVEELLTKIRNEHEQVVTFLADAIYSKTNNYPGALRYACSLLIAVKGVEFVLDALETFEKSKQANQ